MNAQPLLDVAAHERRASTRGGSRLSVFLYHLGQPVAMARVRNASERGMLVDPVPRFVPPPPRGYLLEVGFGVEHGAITRHHRIPVRVVHGGGGGIGLRFEIAGEGVTAIADAAHEGR